MESVERNQDYGFAGMKLSTSDQLATVVLIYKKATLKSSLGRNNQLFTAAGCRNLRSGLLLNKVTNVEKVLICKIRLSTLAMYCYYITLIN